MKAAQSGKNAKWSKTQYSNLIRYVPSGQYFARIRVRGKLILKSLKTARVSVAKLRLADLEKDERTKAENQTSLVNGKMTFSDALSFYRDHLQADLNLKPRSKEYREERINALLKSWPDLKTKDVRQISKHNCQEWARRFGQDCSSIAFNNTIGTLRQILDVAVESGARYDNPARDLKRKKVKVRRPELPSQDQFIRFVETIETSGRSSCYQAAELVRFLAFGGFRKSEAAHVKWADCNFEKGTITVRGDPLTGTKNSEIREVPMIPDMLELLTRLKIERKNDTPENHVMKAKECQISMDKAAKVLTLPRVTHHDLRHLFATRCIESGVDIPTVSRWLGHKDGGALAMKVYGHLRDQHSVAMAQRVSFSRRPVDNLIAMPKHESGASAEMDM
jgi:integrase